MNIIATIFLTLVFPPLASFSVPHVKTLIIHESNKTESLEQLDNIQIQEDNTEITEKSKEDLQNIIDEQQEEIDKQKEEFEDNLIQEDIVDEPKRSDVAEEEIIIDEPKEDKKDKKKKDKKDKDDEEDEGREEKTVSCLTYTDTIVKVSNEECELIKQKNKRSKEIDAEYSSCVDEYNEGMDNCIQEATDRAISAEMLSSTVTWCKNLWDVNEGAQECREIRDGQMKKFWR